MQPSLLLPSSDRDTLVCGAICLVHTGQDNAQRWGERKKIHHLKTRMARCTFALGFHILHVGQPLLVIINDLVLLYEDQVPSEG